MAALVHGVIIVGITFGGRETRATARPGLEVLIVSDDVPEARSNDTATYLAQRTQLGSGNAHDPRGACAARRVRTRLEQRPRRRHRLRRRRRAARHGRQPRANYRRADARDPVLRAARQPHREHRGAGAHRGQQRARQARRRRRPRTSRSAARSATNCGSRPTRARRWSRPISSRWRTKIERLGTLNYPQAAWRAPGTRNPDVEVAILADGTLESATHPPFQRLGRSSTRRRWTS